MTKKKKKLYVVAGATAIGKSTYAIELAKSINGAIISCDAIQVYKGLDIGSAKIAKDEMQGIKHYLIDVVNFDYDFDVAAFVEYASKAIEEIYSKGQIPILCGGAGFYIHALLYGNVFEEENEKRKNEIRDLIYKVRDIKGMDFIYESLKKVDKASYDKIHIHNEKRIIRALEYYMLNNKKISEHNIEEMNRKSDFDFEFYVLTMDKEKLYERINKRVDIMLEQGLLIEIANLIKQGCKKEYRSMQAIGYKELYDFVKEHLDTIQYIHNNIELNELIELVKKNSRNYAKRQDTWFRREKNVKYLNV